jgi:hypothetical protein
VVLEMTILKKKSCEAPLASEGRYHAQLKHRMINTRDSARFV